MLILKALSNMSFDYYHLNLNNQARVSVDNFLWYDKIFYKKNISIIQETHHIDRKHLYDVLSNLLVYQSFFIYTQQEFPCFLVRY